MTAMRVGFVIHGDRADAVAAALRAATALADAGIAVDVVDHPKLADLDDVHAESLNAAATVVDEVSFPAECDLVVSFGGDGTFLRAAHLCRDAEVPLMGVNLGRLGFLAEVEVEHLNDAVATIIARGWEIERRMTLDVEIQDVERVVIHRDWSLNEVSVEKSARQRLVRLDVHIGEEWFANFPADALVVATSTGSTAYALSAGGPIVSPRVQATLVVPVAPHSLFDRTVVTAPDEAIMIDLHDDEPSAVVSCDGREPAVLEPGHRVVVTGSPHDVLVARVQPTAFYELVRRKFNLR